MAGCLLPNENNGFHGQRTVEACRRWISGGDTWAKLYEDVHDEKCGSEEFVARARALVERGK